MVFVCVLLSAAIGLLVYIAALLTKLARAPRLGTTMNIHMDPESARAVAERVWERRNAAGGFGR